MPSNPGIYLFLDEKNDVLYVGKAKNLKSRVSSYFVKSFSFGEKTKVLVSQIKKIRIFIAHSEIEALVLEAKFIKKYKPRYNIRFIDGKSYPLIRITTKDRYPKVLVARRREDKKSIYFGPFPHSSALYLVLKTVRRIFPFQSVLNHPKRICLYHHLNLCPCPSVFDSEELKNEYKKNIKYLADFLNGNTKKVIKNLGKERDIYSRNEEFEKAEMIQKRINAIMTITTSLYQEFDYEVNPNLEQDKNHEELVLLQKTLNEKGVNVRTLRKIECYDISNIQGSNATASMVVFTDGKKNSTLYRKFRIKNDYGGPNDFAMMREILQRRMRHSEWPYPDLIIVDGGKGQITAAKSILKEKNFDIPIIGLAKRNETIISSDFKEINLSKESVALHLLQRIRDEAHRFTVKYHKYLRSKQFIP